jgi:hypothetical protein
VPIWINLRLRSGAIQPRWAAKLFNRNQAKARNKVMISANSDDVISDDVISDDVIFDDLN